MHVASKPGDAGAKHCARRPERCLPVGGFPVLGPHWTPCLRWHAMGRVMGRWGIRALAQYHSVARRPTPVRGAQGTYSSNTFFYLPNCSQKIVRICIDIDSLICLKIYHHKVEKQSVKSCAHRKQFDNILLAIWRRDWFLHRSI